MVDASGSGFVLGGVAWLVAAGAGPALAAAERTQLPEIVVNAPSPIVRPPATPRRAGRAPVTQPAPAAPDAPRRPRRAAAGLAADRHRPVRHRHRGHPRGDSAQRAAARSAMSCSPSPASPARASRPARPAARSCAGSTTTASASRRTASARAACRSSARITPCRSIRWRPSGSRWSAVRRRLRWGSQAIGGVVNADQQPDSRRAALPAAGAAAQLGMPVKAIGPAPWLGRA